MTWPVLNGWKLRRAGGAITIYHSAGKIAGIIEVELTPSGVIATHDDGRKFKLSAWCAETDAARVKALIG